MPVRAPYPVHDSTYELFDYIERRMLFQQAQPIWLGGASGSPGSILPPGGFIGLLPQDKVNYDSYESSGSSVGSAPTLVQNMDRIRGGWALADDAIRERHIYWATSEDVGDQVESRHVPFFSTSGEIASTNVRDAIEEVYAGAAASWHGYTIIVYHADGSAPDQFDADSTGLDAASSSAGSGDVVWIPCMPIGGNHTLAAHVSYVGVSRQATRLTGEITLANDVSLENLTISRTATDDNIKGLVNSAGGSAKVVNCEISCITDGNGNAYAVSIENESFLEVWDSYLKGVSSGGSGYAVHRTFGMGGMYIFGGRAYGSTDEFNE